MLVQFYFVFALCRLTVSSMIVFLLLATTILTLKLLKRNLPLESQSEVTQVFWIYTCFIGCYSLWLGYDLYDAISIKLGGFPSPFVDQLLSMILPFIWDILPVLSVLCLHTKILILQRR